MTISKPARSPLAPVRSGRSVALAALLSAAGLLASENARAQSPQLSRELAGQVHSQFRPGDVRLNFITRRWPDVLRRIAEESGSTLVMDEAPNSLYSRRDLKRYSRSEAVRILNRELELQGYRLREDGQYLILQNLRKLRSEYEQRVLSPAAEMPAAPLRDTAAATPSWERGVVTIASREEPAQARRRGRESAPVRSADHLEEAGSGGVARATSGPPVLIHVPTERNAAADVARIIFTVYKSNAQLIEEGPEGLPAFTVARAGSGGAAPEADYAIGIDTDGQRLVVSAQEPRARQIEQLIRKLDATPVREGETLKLVRAEGDVRGKAARVQALADNLVAQVRIQQVPTDGQPQQPDRPGEERPDQPEEQRPEAQAPGGVPLRLDLQGPVQIQDVPGIGLIITGNRADVEAVTQIIRALELAGAGVTPDIHLLKLRHVNSASLAELLTQVYERVSTMRAPGLTAANIQAPTIQILPVAMPNAILIIAPARDMESVLTLAEELDQPLDPQAEFEVFRLQHAVASQLLTTLQSFFEIDEETGVRAPLTPRARALADVRTNSIIVQARGRDMEEAARLIRRLDNATSGAVSELQVFPLQNAIATQLSLVINEAIQSVLRPPTPTAATGQFPGAAPVGAAGEIPTELRAVKSAILEFLATDGDTERLIRSGILSDIRVTADPGRNALIVTAPEQSMEMVAALIAHLDQPTPLVAEVKVITLANSDATAAADLLRTLFAAPGAGVGQQGFPGAAGQNQIAVQIAGAEGAGAGLIPLRFSVDTRTNSIVVMGPAEAIDIVQAILLRLDESDIRQRQMRVIKLSNTPALEIATAINQFLTAQRGLAQVDPDLVTTIELLEREVIIVPEVISNSVIVSATPRYFDEIVAMIERIDRKPPEVMIQAMIVEVELDNVDEFGVELGFQDEVLFSRSVNGIPGFNFNNLPFGNNPVNPASIGAQGLSDLGLARTNDEFGFGGLVLAAGSESVSVLIRALSAKRTVHVLSRPQIRTLDNQLAQIVVGQLVPIVTGVSPSGLTGGTPITTPTDVGIILAVVPRVSPDGTIVIETIATRSALSGQGVPIFVNSETGSVIESPIINQTQAQATISVPNGQTVVLGGMITKNDNAFERKIPWLGDVPYLGYAFRYDGVRTRRTELLIFLTPRIIRHEADSELIKRVEAERLHFIEQDLEDAHGPLYSAPPPDWMGELGMPGAGYCPPPLFDDSDVPTTILGPMDYSVAPIPGGRMESREIVPDQAAPIPTMPPPAPPAPETFFPETP